MDLLEAIRGRRSIRTFKRKDIMDKTVEEIIDAGRWAPSAGNIQPWEFIIVRNLEIKKRLAAAALDQNFVTKAPVVIVVCANEHRSSMGYGLRGKTLYCIQDTAAATQNMLLAAHSLGIGSCWIGAFREDEAREIQKIPSGVRPVAIIALGYPAEFPSPPHKRTIDNMVHYEIY